MKLTSIIHLTAIPIKRCLFRLALLFWKIMEKALNTSSRRSFQRTDYVKITIFGFALTALWQSLHTIILPLRLLDFVVESQKNTYLGLLTFTGLILAMAAQPIAGAISDRYGFSWGRRRPYILFGTMAALLFLPGIGFSGSYLTIFIVYCLLQVCTNTAQGPYQAFIPDLVPEGKRGLASGVKGLLETLGGIALIYPVAIFMDRYFLSSGEPWLWLALAALGTVLLAAMVASLLLVKESPATRSPRISLLSTLYETFKIDISTNRSFLWFLVSRLLVFMGFATIQQFALNFLRDVVGVRNPAEATAQVSILGVISILVVVWPSGYLSDRIGRKPIAITAGLLGALGVTIIFLSPTYGSILLAMVFIGIALGAFNSANWALATDLLPENEKARYLGLTNVATAGGAALARLIGPVIDFFNRYGSGLGYQVMLLTCAIYFIAGSLLILKVKPPD